MSKKNNDNDGPAIMETRGNGGMPLTVGLTCPSPAAILQLAGGPAPDLDERPLDRLLWEIGWFARSESYEPEDQLDRVVQVVRFLVYLGQDPRVSQAWQVCPAGVSRLLTLAVAHFPVSVGEDGVLHTWEWAFFMTDPEVEDDKSERLPRPEEEGER